MAFATRSRRSLVSNTPSDPLMVSISPNDAHCHFFSERFFDALGREKYRDRPAPAEAVARELGWEAADRADALADRWVAELDCHRVSRSVLIASVPGDEESV